MDRESDGYKERYVICEFATNDGDGLEKKKEMFIVAGYDEGNAKLRVKKRVFGRDDVVSVGACCIVPDGYVDEEAPVTWVE